MESTLPKHGIQMESTLPNLVFQMESMLPHFVTHLESIVPYFGRGNRRIDFYNENENFQIILTDFYPQIKF